MGDLPEFLASGERARLFPVLADTSKEGRATSIFLACLSNVREFADQLLRSVGRPIGVTSRISAFTEVSFKKSHSDTGHRPDGLIIVRTGNSQWTALVEAKIGNAELSDDQIETYLKLARAHGIDAVITLSNQHATSASDHPVKIDKKTIGNTTLFHWSWMDILTAADLLLTNNQVEDHEQRILLNEFRRFLSHDSTGVKGFDRMPSEWPELIRDLGAGAHLTNQSEHLTKVIRAWHLELQNLSLVLSRQIGVPASVKLSRAEERNPDDRLKNSCSDFLKNQCLTGVLFIPEAAANIDVSVDARARTFSVGAKLDAPADRKRTTSKINWLLSQIKDVPPENTFIRVHWPRRAYTQHTLAELRQDVNIAAGAYSDLTPSALEVVVVKHTDRRFTQVTGFVEDIEKIVPEFYGSIGSRLKAWQPPAPTIRPERNDRSDVSREAISEDAEETAAELSNQPDPQTQKKKFWF